MSLQLPTETLQLATSQNGLAVLPLQVDLLLHYLRLLLLQGFQTLLHAAALLQLNTQRSLSGLSLYQFNIYQTVLDSAVKPHSLIGTVGSS